MNVCKSYTPKTVTTIDGRQVLSESEEWRACCEAVRVLSRPQADREDWLKKIEQRRGESGRRKLEAEMNRIEPAYLLALGHKEARRAYLEQTEKFRGPVVRERLEQDLVALWRRRKEEQQA